MIKTWMESELKSGSTFLSLHGEESDETGTGGRAQVSGHRGAVGNITSGLTAEKAHLSLPLCFHSSSASTSLSLQS